jgi:hypothetical protein
MNEEKDLNQAEETQKFRPGEKGFAVFLLIFGLFFTWQSWKLYQESPEVSSYGTVPLFCSAVITLLSLVIIIVDWKKKSVSTGKPIGEVIKAALSYLFAQDVLVMIVLVLVYCITLYMGLGFMIVTPLFLWISMSYLSRGNYVKNILWTALCMLFIYLVFKMLFSVVLP